MAGVIIVETEKLLFRNNISQNAQHFALSFLANVARYTEADNSAKLLKICFAFFKIKTEKGEVNSKTMKLILLCIRTAVGKSDNPQDLIPEDTLNVIYKLIYLSDIGTALQALAVLLQVVLNRPGGHDRFYNALYRKMLDQTLAHTSPKVSSLFFHILHRAILNDRNHVRAQAFIKRLLQISLHFPSAKICGSLVLVHKILKARAPLLRDGMVAEENSTTENKDEKDEESEDEGTGSGAKSSWVHAKISNSKKEENAEVKSEKENDIKTPMDYDPFNRSAAFAGAQFTKKYELMVLLQHFHPSVKVFADQVINHKAITYYGDPLKDFALSTFLDRFSFKNPKQANQEEKKRTVFKNTYRPQGSRGISVHSLTRQNCTEDEKFIFEFLRQKRDRRSEIETKIKEEKGGESDEDVSDVESVDDDEFNDYLDGLGAAQQDFDDENDEIDYMKELGSELVENKKTKKSKKAKETEEDESDDNWAEEGSEMDEDDSNADSDGGSISFDEGELDDGDDSDESAMTFSDDADSDDESTNKSKKRKTSHSVSDKEFNKKLKDSSKESLFAAADDFADMLEETGKTKGHGTLGEFFNKDRSSDKQIAWEQSKMKKSAWKNGKSSGGFKGKKGNNHSSFNKKSTSFKKNFKSKNNAKKFNSKKKK